MKEKELEEAVGELYNKIKDVPADLIIAEDITQGELLDVLKRMRGFINYVKFEFGEDITEG